MRGCFSKIAWKRTRIRLRFGQLSMATLSWSTQGSLSPGPLVSGASRAHLAWGQVYYLAAGITATVAALVALLRPGGTSAGGDAEGPREAGRPPGRSLRTGVHVAHPFSF